MKKFISILAILISINAQSQFLLDDSQSLNWLIDSVLLGGGVTVQNATFNSSSDISATNQLGFFNTQGIVDFPLNKGVIMATGGIEVCQGPNGTSSSTVLANNSISGDSDLEILSSGAVFNDIAVLEFDFIPQQNTLIYQYVFASEEYLEFVGSSFNDAFAFFVSGPGISGPFSNNAMNVALIPGTTDYVSINNVNDGMNSTYFYDNSVMGDSTQTQFDGYTIEMPVAINVTPNETYHIKMIVGDAFDSAYDSAVFIKNQSFMSIAEEPSAISEILVDDLVSAFPIPSQDLLNLNSKNSNLFINAVTIFDISGRKVMERQFNSKTSIQMDISALVAGNYSISILTNEGYLTKNIVKE